MKSLKERLEKKIEKDATNRSMRQCSTGHIDLDKAISWYLKVGFESGAASLVPLVVELEQLTQDTKEFLYLLQEDMEFYKESACLPTQDEIDQVRIHRQIVIEALQSIEKLMGEK